MDIKAEYEEALEEGMNIKKATKQVLESFEDVLDDMDEGPVIYLSLAALQVEKGIVLKKIRQKALEIIDSGQGLERWEEAGADLLNKRKAILNDLKKALAQATEI